MKAKAALRITRQNRCEACEIERAMVTGDSDALDHFIAEGKILVLEPEQVATFHDSLSERERRVYEVLREAEGTAVAFGFIIQQRMQATHPDLQVNYPGRRLQ